MESFAQFSLEVLLPGPSGVLLGSAPPLLDIYLGGTAAVLSGPLAQCAGIASAGFIISTAWCGISQLVFPVRVMNSN